jgi:hypothetical protein
MLSLADYTVGWICALETELTAARGMLDKCHSPPVLPENDWNSYIPSVGLEITMWS